MDTDMLLQEIERIERHLAILYCHDPFDGPPPELFKINRYRRLNQIAGFDLFQIEEEAASV